MCLSCSHTRVHVIALTHALLPFPAPPRSVIALTHALLPLPAPPRSVIDLRAYLPAGVPGWAAEDALAESLYAEAKLLFTPGRAMHAAEPGACLAASKSHARG